ncbi:MAG TPA: hypothetical protein EYP93_01070 [Gammaproteobacteria bacterium]|nr:hypothetical protein [Gammaproteobacteria bacterium]
MSVHDAYDSAFGVRHEMSGMKLKSVGHEIRFYCQLLNQVINKCLGKVIFAAATPIALRAL